MVGKRVNVLRVDGRNTPTPGFDEFLYCPTRHSFAVDRTSKRTPVVSPLLDVLKARMVVDWFRIGHSLYSLFAHANAVAAAADVSLAARVYVHVLCCRSPDNTVLLSVKKVMVIVWRDHGPLWPSGSATGLFPNSFLCTLIHNKLLVHGLYKIISNINFFRMTEI